MKNSQLTKLRDESLVKEFHELYDIKRIRLEDVLNKLSLKFFLDTSYIYKRIFYIQENKELYFGLKEHAKS